MQIEELIRKMGQDPEDKKWQFALKHIYVNFPVDVKDMNCIEGYPCWFARYTITGRVDIGETEGFVITSDTGILVICPAEDDFPVNDWVSKKDIRIVEAESTLFKGYVRVKTNSDVYSFRVSKKIVKDVERMANNVRNF